MANSVRDWQRQQQQLPLAFSTPHTASEPDARKMDVLLSQWTGAVRFRMHLDDAALGGKNLSGDIRPAHITTRARNTAGDQICWRGVGPITHELPGHTTTHPPLERSVLMDGEHRLATNSLCSALAVRSSSRRAATKSMILHEQSRRLRCADARKSASIGLEADADRHRHRQRHFPPFDRSKSAASRVTDLIATYQRTENPHRTPFRTTIGAEAEFAVTDARITARSSTSAPLSM
ncbi:hypothetical protein CERZMDRAFT_89272 [Cercospora zeae-maydis SCOH1-5]|uniref:Uncharacterized protein n=1 Tax=Cercospora zeae-maydis SCOH1-5 TaxID=717836 RepID=A0A6A6EVX2_9PEZI|nr:hypothetical protein CERZMDRAFT_89272 [Cercospora zeae-maydis SCOH1-5]